jgi:hypothetical protein
MAVCDVMAVNVPGAVCDVMAGCIPGVIWCDVSFCCVFLVCIYRAVQKFEEKFNSKKRS